MSSEDDWLFDYVLQFLESEKFDSVIMDFVDEKCEAFDNEEENKFIYTEIHREFRETVDALISSNLGELGVTVEMFFEACRKGRFSRDINQAVVERMVAMDDFMTFKKIMVKRNMELQLEALKACNYPRGGRSGKKPRDDDDDDDDNFHFTPEHQAEMERLIQDSIMEMEMLHVQAEMEALELERVLAMSLAIEEEKLCLMQTELEEYERSHNAGPGRAGAEDEDAAQSKEADDDDYEKGKRSGASMMAEADAKSAPSAAAAPASTADSSGSKSEAPRASAAASSKNTDSDDTAAAAPKLKPLPALKLKADFKPLPSIGAPVAANSPKVIADLAEELEAKKRQVEQQFKMNLISQKEQREKLEELRAQVSSSGKGSASAATDGMSKKQKEEEEARIRAQHMREQRDRIVALKRREREEKVAAEEAAAKAAHGQSADGIDDAEKMKALRRKAAKEEKGLSDTELVEKQQADDSKRGAMRNALAHRMKMDLLSGTSSSSSSGGSNGGAAFSDLDEKLRKLDALREETTQKSEDIARNVSSKARHT